MARGLVRTVIVEDDHGERVTLRPGQPVPAWARNRIRNPAAWGEVTDVGLPGASSTAPPSGAVEAPPSAPTPDVPPAPDPDRAPGETPAEVPDVDRLDEPTEVEPSPEPPPHADPPPKGGRGSSAAAWRAYAHAVEVEVPADMERDDVIATLERANVRTE